MSDSQSGEYADLIFRHSVDGLLLSTPEGRIIKANPAACRMLGRTEEELRRLGRESIVDMTDPRVAAGLEQRRRDGKVVSALRFILPDGRRVEIQASSTIFKDRDGSLKSSVVLREIGPPGRVDGH